MTALRLVTYNIHHGVGGDGRHDLVRLAGLLARSQADVICLQEVDRHFGDRSEQVDQALLLAEALDRELVWGPAIDRPPPVPGAPPAPGAARRQYGNALLSRLPVLDGAVLALPGDGEPRSAVTALLALDGTAVTVLATHLTTRGPSDRAAQAAAVAGLLPADGPAVVAGDFNCLPTAAELAPLRARLADGWQQAAVRSDRAGWRFWQRERGLTHPARRPRGRIDQVWVSPQVRVTRAEVLDGSACSDHHPLQVDLAID